MIRRVGKNYNIYSEKSGRRLGSYRSKAAAVKRLREIEYWKRHK